MSAEGADASTYSYGQNAVGVTGRDAGALRPAVAALS